MQHPPLRLETLLKTMIEFHYGIRNFDKLQFFLQQQEIQKLLLQKYRLIVNSCHLYYVGVRLQSYVFRSLNVLW